MLSFLLNQIWIGIDDFLLNFYVTFDLVLGLQVTVLIRISQIHWLNFWYPLRLFLVFV